MRGTSGVLVGLILFVIGLSGLGLALAQMMTHADPNAGILAAAGLGAFVAASLISVIIMG